MAKSIYPEWSDEEHLVQIQGWARDGLKDVDIAKNIGIGKTTFYKWKKKYVAFANALKDGKEVVDRKVENALLKKALGLVLVDKQYRMVKIDETQLKAKRTRYMNEYKLDHPEATKQEIALEAAEKVPTYERIQMYETHHELPPDTTALIFWLKNRKPEEYRDKSFQNLNNAQAEKAKAELRKALADADLAELKVEAITGDGDNQERVVIMDDFTEKEDETDGNSSD